MHYHKRIGLSVILLWYCTDMYLKILINTSITLSIFCITVNFAWVLAVQMWWSCVIPIQSPRIFARKYSVVSCYSAISCSHVSCSAISFSASSFRTISLCLNTHEKHSECDHMQGILHRLQHRAHALGLGRASYCRCVNSGCVNVSDYTIVSSNITLGSAVFQTTKVKILQMQ